MTAIPEPATLPSGRGIVQRPQRQLHHARHHPRDVLGIRRAVDVQPHAGMRCVAGDRAQEGIERSRLLGVVIGVHLRLAARDAPKAQLQAFCHAIIDRWLGDSGRVFVALLALAQQNSLFAALHEEVYRNFHAALEPILHELDSKAAPTEIATRAMLVTALIDGAPAQLLHEHRKGFVDRVAALALEIGLGRAG